MTREVQRSRCECCDEVLKELLGMRQSFENSFQRFANQIAELQRELCSRTVVAASLNGEQKTEAWEVGASSSAVLKETTTAAIKRKATADCSRNHVDIPEDDLENGGNDDDNDNDDDEAFTGFSTKRPRIYKAESASFRTQKTFSVDESSKETENSITLCSVKRPAVDFFGIRLRVMPTCPFSNATEFEQWESLLMSDEDQQNHLRMELMQGRFDDAEKYVKHIWNSVLGNEAAMCYSLRGNTKTDKKAVKNMTFTSIFKECFLQRYERLDDVFFMERTMRFFNYAHDRQRRMSKIMPNSFESAQLMSELIIDQKDCYTADENNYNCD